MSQYLDQYTAYKFALPTVEAVQEERKRISLLAKGGNIEKSMYNDRMKALATLEEQIKDTEARRARWVNAGQVKNV